MFLRLCRMTLSITISSLKVGKNLSKLFDTYRGFIPGDVFNCSVENVLSKAEHYLVKLLGQVGDINIIGCTKRKVTAAICAMKCESADIGLLVNKSKAKYMLQYSYDMNVVSLLSTFQMFWAVITWLLFHYFRIQCQRSNYRQRTMVWFHSTSG